MLLLTFWLLPLCQRERQLERKRRFISHCKEQEEARILAEEQARIEDERAEEGAKAAARRAQEEDRRAKLEEAARKHREREEIERKKVRLHQQFCRIVGGRADGTPAPS